MKLVFLAGVLQQENNDYVWHEGVLIWNRHHAEPTEPVRVLELPKMAVRELPTPKSIRAPETFTHLPDRPEPS